MTESTGMSTSYGSLFSGAGGFDLGCDAAGWECHWQVEWDKKAASVLARHWPNVPRWSDVRDVSGSDLLPVDVITFGFPCQDLSTGGKRAGLDGSRSGLFFEATRIIREMREATDGKCPRIVIAENVRGLLNADKGIAMGRCLDEMALVGAVDIEWRVLDAKYFGVPQRRRRVFIVASFNPRTTGCGSILPQSESVYRDNQALSAEGEDVVADIDEGIGDCGESIALPKIIGTLTTTSHQYGNTQVEQGFVLPVLALSESSLAVRRLTPRECERLQGWPDDHTRWDSNGKEYADPPRYKMIGNGVALPVAQWIAEKVQEAL